MTQLPQDFMCRMQDMLREAYPAFLRSYEDEKAQALRVNALKGTKEEFLAKADFGSLREVAWEKNGLYYTETSDCAPGKHPFHEAGVYYIQEPSAMAPAVYLEAQPGEHVLDLCAAPGGKTTQIASYMQNQGILVCNEIHAARAKILSENVERMGIRNALVTNETPRRLAEIFDGYFDRILVDAPCSGEGMFRKNEEARGEWSLANVQLCADRQDEILDCADRMLRPGGRLVYATCTFAPAENEGSIARFLERHSEFRSGRIMKQTVPAAVGRQGMKRTALPDLARTGRKTAEPPSGTQYGCFRIWFRERVIILRYSKNTERIRRDISRFRQTVCKKASIPKKPKSFCSFSRRFYKWICWKMRRIGCCGLANSST